MVTPVLHAQRDTLARHLLAINVGLVERWLVQFLRDELIRKRGIYRVVLGLSGGIDSAVAAFLAAQALGPENVFSFRLPYRISSSESLEHGALLAKQLGLVDRVVPITQMVDGYLAEAEADANSTRIGNVCSRCRMTILFDQAAKMGAVPLGTGNKTERFFGYFTWHGDDAPPINPLGDLYKTQVLALARHLGIPDIVINKPPTADLVKGQTDEDDFGITYALADQILALHLYGLTDEGIARRGFLPADIALVKRKVATTHWKRHLPTVAVLSDSSINEFYRRPLDYVGAT